MSHKNRVRALRGGFTLIEAIVIIVILGVIAALVAPRLLGRIGESKQSRAKADAATISTQVELFKADCGRYPETVDELVTKPGDVADDAWKGPYLRNANALIDPWGNKFILRVPGDVNFDFDVVSYGFDGQPGGEDEAKDIVGG